MRATVESRCSLDRPFLQHCTTSSQALRPYERERPRLIRHLGEILASWPSPSLLPIVPSMHARIFG